MIKQTLALLLIPVYCLCQSNHLGHKYESRPVVEGKQTQVLTLKADSFLYRANAQLTIPGTYKVSEDSLILTSPKLPAGYPLIFRIKGNKLVAFNAPRNSPDWYLLKVE